MESKSAGANRIFGHAQSRVNRTILAEPGRLLLLGVAVLTTRLPFLSAGYGIDSDAWRLADVARSIHVTGAYGASRLPGHPVQEFASSWLWPGGTVALNGATALLSVVAVLSFVNLLRQLRSPHPVLSGLALAATPVFYINSTNAMDYLWALSFFMVAINFARIGRSIPAGVLLGLAIGCRITFALFLLPFGVLFLWRASDHSRKDSTLRFLVSALLVGAIAYMPVVLEYGLGFLRTYQTAYPRYVYVLKQMTLDVWGLVGLIGVVLSFGFLVFRAIRSGVPGRMPDQTRLKWMVISLIMISLTAVSYLLLPHDSGYLIPAVPFAILLLGYWLPKRAYVLLCISLLISPLVLKLTEGATPSAPARTKHALPITFSGWDLRLEPFQGPILFDRARRLSEMKYVRSIIDDPAAGAAERIVIVHDWLAMIRVLSGGDSVRETRYVSSMSLDSLRYQLDRGVTVYYLPEADWPNESVHGFRLIDHGARLLIPQK